MANMPEMLRPTEAAVVSGVDLRDVNHAIDRGVLPEGSITRSPGRGVSAAACLFLTFYHGSAKRLTAEERLSAIREAGRRLAGRPIETSWASSIDDWVVRDAFLRIDLEPFVVITSERWRRYRAAQASVTSSPETLSGTPVVKGTRIPVHDVAASVAAGIPIERIRAAYPGLSADQIELSVVYARANPARGRPRAGPLLSGADPISEERMPRRRTAG